MNNKTIIDCDYCGEGVVNTVVGYKEINFPSNEYFLEMDAPVERIYCCEECRISDGANKEP